MIEDKYLTRKQVQRMLKLTREEMLKLITEQKLKAYRLDNCIVFKYEDVDKFMLAIEQEGSSDKSKNR
ncbi:helix-turn-helix domain-containing protein [bacterium]|nr:helix-turn-helix domain-containing protein [bacterium]